MAKAWTNIALVEADVTKVAARELFKKSTELGSRRPARLGSLLIVRFFRFGDRFPFC
jgi:hypothetical protein